MKRWAVISALTLPLPFAAMPLVAIAFNSSAPPSPEDQPAVHQAPAPEVSGEADSGPFGFSVNTDGPSSCVGLEHRG